jgi:hypothetical protein
MDSRTAGPITGAKLRLADQAFVSLLTAVTFPVFHELEWERMVLAELPAILPHVTRGHLHLDPIIRAAEARLAVEALPPGEQRAARSRAIMDCNMALAPFWRWRGALAHGAWAEARATARDKGRAA